MNQMRIPAYFQGLPEQALRVGRPLTSELMTLLVGNSGWLYEAVTGQAVPGHDLSRIDRAFDHSGAGSGAPVATAQSLLRGWFGSGHGFREGLLIEGDGRDRLAPMRLPDFHYGGAVDGLTQGYTWRNGPTSPVPLHPYGRHLRTRLEARCTGPGQRARLTPLLFADEAGHVVLATGTARIVESQSFETCELHLDAGLQEGTRIAHFGVLVWVAPDQGLELRDSDDTGACLALTSFEE